MTQTSSILLSLSIAMLAGLLLSRLAKKIELPAEIDFMKVSSYGSGSKSTGNINIILDLRRDDLSETDILIVEDIIDSGKTLSFLSEYLTLKGAKSVKTVALLDKPSRRTNDLKADYSGFVIPDEFVVGYGLDYAEKFRDLPFVGVLSPKVYKK